MKKVFLLIGIFIVQFMFVTGVNADNCLSYKNSESNCLNNFDKVACVWVENEDAPNGAFCNVDNLLYVGCGDSSDIPVQVPVWISFLVNLLKIGTPIILIFVSLITLIKALAASKEDEIKKAQSSLIKKMIAAAMVFFIIAIVQFVISKVAEDDTEYQNFTDCMNCFLNNKCATTTYYKTTFAGEDYCTVLGTGKTYLCSEISSNNRTEITIKQDSPTVGYYLVGTLDGEDYWYANGNTTKRKLEGGGNEYTIEWNFKKGDEIKIASFDGEKLNKWYNDGGENYKVTEDIKGTLYFNPEGNKEWPYYYFIIK